MNNLTNTSAGQHPRAFEIGDLIVINDRTDLPAMYVTGVIHDQEYVFARDLTGTTCNGGELRFGFEEVTEQYRNVNSLAAENTRLRDAVRELREWIESTIHLCGYSREKVRILKLLTEKENLI